uniref:Uncharacterized protein n=1 Tax=Arundo donax TaxID=35708 RepID=A0A0A8Z065_ARUDO
MLDTYFCLFLSLNYTSTSFPLGVYS